MYSRLWRFTCVVLRASYVAFVTYVRPILQYGTIALSGHQVSYVTSNRTKRFHKEARWHEVFIMTNAYKSLASSRQLRLELRWLHLDLIFCYKILFGWVSVYFNDFLKYGLLQPQLLVDMHKNYNLDVLVVCGNFFTERVINPWNSLPPTLLVSHLCLNFDKRYVMLIFLVLYLVISYIMFV